jgi:hypothetical protein
MNKRVCAVCGTDLYRKWTWAEHHERGKHLYICMACGPKGWQFWPDGSIYNRHDGPTTEQREWLKGQEESCAAPF